MRPPGRPTSVTGGTPGRHRPGGHRHRPARAGWARATAAPDARHQGEQPAHRPRVGARGQVGRRAHPRRPVRRARRHRPAVEPQRQRRRRRVARRGRQPRRCARPARRRRGDRAQRGGRARLPGAPGAPARTPRAHRRAAGRVAAGDVHGLRPAAPRRHRPHRPAAARAACPARRPRPGPLAGAGGVRRRGDAARRDPRAGARGRREQAARLALHLRAAQPALAQAGPPAPSLLRGRRLAPPGGQQRPAGGAAGGGAHPRRARLPRAGRQRHRRAGLAPAHRPGRRPGPRRQPLRRRGARRRRPRHALARAGAGRRRRHPRTGHARLRQPSYRGLRDDLSPDDLRDQS